MIDVDLAGRRGGAAAVLAAVSVTAALAAGGTVSPVAAAPAPGAPPQMPAATEGGGRCAAPGGPVLELNAGLTGQVGPDIPVAFNSQEGEYLVAWNQGEGPADVFVRRVGVDGSLPGAPTPAVAGPDLFVNPALAYHPDHNQYLISWRFQGGAPGSPDFNNAFGRLLTATGEPDVGEVFHVSPAGFEPTVVANPVTGEYLHHARNFAGGGTPGVLFRRIDSLGQPLAEPTQIVPLGGPGEAEVNPLSGEYLSTWRGAIDEDPVLRGQLLSPTGAPVGDSFVIADLFPGVETASVAFDPELARYLVVFSTFFEPSPLLHAQFVSAQGELEGPMLTLVDQNADRPRVAYDPVNQVFLVTWFAAGSGLWGQLLSPHGDQLGEPRNLAAGTLVHSPTGRVAANSVDGGFLVSWRRGEAQVAARTVAVVGDCPVSLDPPGIDFGEQEVGAASPPRSVTIENTGDSGLPVGSLAVGGDHPDDFRIGDDGCSGQLLAPGGTCTFDVRFSPAATDLRAGVVEVHSDAATSPDLVALAGVGVAPLVVLLPGTLDFGEVPLGESAPAQRFEVFNNGTGALRVGDLAVEGSHAGDFDLVDDACSGHTLGVRELCSVEVTFTPSATGARTARVAVPSNAATSPDPVGLQGIGVGEPPAIELEPPELVASLAAGEQEAQLLTVHNRGDEPLAWEITESGPAATGLTRPPAGTSQDCGLPAWIAVQPRSGTVAGGASQPVEVTLDSTGLTAGEHSASLCVASNDPLRPLVPVPVTLTVREPDPGGCDRTVTGVHPGPLTVTGGVTCLAAGAQVLGEVNVRPGASLVATAAVVQGPLSATGADRLELRFSQVTGPVAVSGTTGGLWLFGNQVTGSVLVMDSATGETQSVVAGNTIIGSLACFGNQPEPTHLGLPNVVTAGTFGQCARL